MPLGLKITRLLLLAGIILSTTPAARAAQPDPPAEPINHEESATTMTQDNLIYHVEEGGIARHNGDRYHNRPLYLNRMPGVVLGGDRPLPRFARDPYIFGCLLVGVVRDGQSKWLHELAGNTAIYHPGRMTWRLTDPALAGLTLMLEVAPMADAAGFAARLTASGTRPGDQLVWAFGGATQRPPTSADGLGNVAGALDPVGLGQEHLMKRGFVPEDCRGDTVTLAAGGFTLTPPPYPADKKLPVHVVTGRCSAPTTLTVAAAQDWASPLALAASKGSDLPLACGVTPLDASQPAIAWAIEAFDGPAATDTQRLLDPAKTFAAALARAEAVGRQVVVDTPDPMLNAAAGADCAAMDALLRPPAILHGGMQYNQPYLGWRTMYGPTVFGWHDRVRETAAYYLATQETSDTLKQQHSDPALGLSGEAHDSRFYGRGRINHPDNYMYDMQSLFFDMVEHAWRWTGDPAIEALLRKTIELHIEWITDCFDPDGDGLYESYLNTAEADNVWANGGGTPEETAYAYAAHRAAADLARRAGDTGAGQRHRAAAEKIRQSFMRGLWIPAKGHPGASREQYGHQRLREDAWLYDIFLPIEAGMLTPEEAAQALDYTEWGLERVTMPGGGQRCWTSNWIPTDWSNRMLWPAHSYSLALAYAKAGLPEESWTMLKGGFIPANFNETSPGGFASGTTGSDFHDEVCNFGRSVVEGLFGLCPDIPNGLLHVAPQFPVEWPRAAIKTPDFDFTYTGGGEFTGDEGREQYAIKMRNPVAIDFRLPVRARKIEAVEVNGASAQWKMEPGFGQAVVVLQAPPATNTQVTVRWSQPLPYARPLALEARTSEPLVLKTTQGPILEVHDPQGVLTACEIKDGAATGRATANAGHHLVFALVDCGATRHWQSFKVTVRDLAAEAAKAAADIRTVAANPRWETIDLGATLNGDVREIFKQKYLEPRPKTCSLRIGLDGYTSWPFYYWSSNPQPPVIDLAGVAPLLDSAGKILKAHNVPFAWPGEARNIAFTSLWKNWPTSVTVPVARRGGVAWFLICGSTNPMQTGIANAELRLSYADGVEDKLELIPPQNFWSLCLFANRTDYDTKRDAFCLSKTPPLTVQLGQNCRAMLIGRHLRPDADLASVSLETLSPEVVIGLMGLTLMSGE